MKEQVVGHGAVDRHTIRVTWTSNDGSSGEYEIEGPPSMPLHPPLHTDADCIRRAKELLPQGLQDVLEERYRQDAKWGEQNHDPFTYLSILMEEAGELAQAALHARFGGPKAAGLRKEAVHAAAVGLAIIECLDRNKWHWQPKP